MSLRGQSAPPVRIGAGAPEVVMRHTGPRPAHILANHLRPALVLLLFLVGVLLPTTPAATPAPRLFEAGPPTLCQGDADCLARRWIEVDLAAFGGEGARWMSYSPEALLRPVRDLDKLDDEERVVRLVLSEVGIDRLSATVGGPTEALGLVYAALNRLDEAVANPRHVQGYRPYPGCGDAGSLRRCLNPGQFLGMATPRALSPGRGARPARLAVALDIAVSAYRVAVEKLAPDPTFGATEWVHRCGGTAYGAKTTACDEASERAAGASAHDGPLVFKAPHRVGPNGAYTLRESVVVPYRSGRPASPRVWAVRPPA